MKLNQMSRKATLAVVAWLFVIFTWAWQNDFFHIGNQEAYHWRYRFEAAWWDRGLFILGCMVLVEVLARLYKRKASRETALWTIVTLVVAFANGYWHEDMFNLFYDSCIDDFYELLNFFTWPLLGVYTLARTSLLAEGRSGLLTPVDCLTALFWIPLRNIGAIGKCLFSFRTEASENSPDAAPVGKRSLLSFVLSLLFPLLVFIITVAIVVRIDETIRDFVLSSFLHTIVTSIGDFIYNIFEDFWQDLLMLLYEDIIPLIAVASYIFGMAYGAVKRDDAPLTATKIFSYAEKFRTIPGKSTTILFSLIAIIYLIFFISQTYNFFTYVVASPKNASEFAVHGFEATCCVMAVNIGLLFAASFISRREPPRLLLTFFNLFAIGFVILAAAKLYTYIDYCGLTNDRITAAYAIFGFALISLLALLRPYIRMQAARIAVIALALLLAQFSTLDKERLVVRNHLNRYLSGKSENLDIDFLKWNQIILERAEFSERNADLVRDLNNHKVWDNDGFASDFYIRRGYPQTHTNEFLLAPSDKLTKICYYDGTNFVTRIISVTITQATEEDKKRLSHR